MGVLTCPAQGAMIREERHHMASVEKINQITHNSHLNFYELETRKRTGKKGIYYLASRAVDENSLEIRTHENHPDGVTIFSVYGEKKDKVVLVHQFRYPLGTYVYEFPAGLVEKGENYSEGAVREMREETGLVFHPLKVDPLYEKPYYNSVGMTDESCAMVYGYSEGQISEAGLEETEQLDVVLADRNEIIRILKEERVAANCAYMLMHFLDNPEDPFSFLRSID